MSEISIVGLDLAKNVFQVHAVDGTAKVVLRRQLRRGAVAKFFAELLPCMVSMEACGSAHYWARLEQQASLALHSTRSLLVRQRTMIANSLRPALGELGIVA